MSDPKELAADLRRLRLAHGGPTYEALARATGLSRSTIADAFSGNRVPSERTLFAVVSALGEDPEEWIASRAAIVHARGTEDAEELQEDVAGDALDSRPAASRAAEPSHTLQAEPADSEDDQEVGGERALPGPSRSGKRAARRTISVAVLIPLLLVALAAGAVAGHLWWPASAGQDGVDGAQTRPVTGEDVVDTRCADDGIVIASANRGFETQVSINMSNACNAVWARVYRYDGNAHGNEIRIELSPRREGVDPGPAQEASEMDARGAVTPMIVRNSDADRFCAQAWVTNDGMEFSLGDPICV